MNDVSMVMCEASEFLKVNDNKDVKCCEVLVLYAIGVYVRGPTLEKMDALAFAIAKLRIAMIMASATTDK